MNPIARLRQSVEGRIKSYLSSIEGSWRGPFFGQGEQGSWFPIDPIGDGWQQNLIVDTGMMQYIPAVSGGVHLYGSAGAQLRPNVMIYDKEGNVEINTTTAASRVLVNPNPFESGSEFQCRAFRNVVLQGMACIVGMRNDRYEVAQMYILEPRTWSLYVDPETKEPFVALNQDGILTRITEATMMVPMRDVFIFKWAASRKNPLLGESPLEAAGFAASIYTALSRTQAAFFHNMRRPSGALITDELLTVDQMRQLRTAFDEQSKLMQAGGIPILAGGLKWNQMAITSQDAQAIETVKLSNEEIARAIGVPPPLLGQLDNATLSNVEQLVSHWMSISLGGLIERYERGLDRLFGFDSTTKRIEMDTQALLRTDFAERMQSYGRAIQGGVMTPNEARRKEGLSPVDGGDDVFMQRQMTAVSLLRDLNQNELISGVAPEQPEPEEPDPDSENEEQDDEEEEKRFLELQEKLSGIGAQVMRLIEFNDQLHKQADEFDSETTGLIVRDAIQKAMKEVSDGD